MKPSDSKEALLRRLAGTQDSSVAGALLVMLNFYAEERADGCLIEKDGDMLLYQWGTYDWGQGEHFELDLTRQFILEDEDEPFQLSMTFLFEATDEQRQLGKGNQWCLSPESLAEFREFVFESAPYRMIGELSCPQVSVEYFQC